MEGSIALLTNGAFLDPVSLTGKHIAPEPSRQAQILYSQKCVHSEVYKIVMD